MREMFDIFSVSEFSDGSTIEEDVSFLIDTPEKIMELGVFEPYKSYDFDSKIKAVRETLETRRDVLVFLLSVLNR